MTARERAGRHARRGPARRLLAVAVAAPAALAGLLLAGCGLATSGPVVPGLSVDSGGGQDVRVRFPGPADGATPEQVVRGFIRAGSESEGSYDSAREFLTDEASRAWQPDARLDILATQSSISVDPVDATTVRLRGTLEAQIDASGRYAAQPPQTRLAHDIRLATVDGQWRIASLPKGFGRWIASSDVRRLVQPYAVHFLATDRRLLVPDLRWFPLDHLSSRLARAQLDPVPAYLLGAAGTAIPTGTKLTADSVVVNALGVATVELTGRMPTDSTVRATMWAQLVSTLTQDPQVTGVVVHVNGAALDLPGLEPPVSLPAEVGFPLPAVAEHGLYVRAGDTVSAFARAPDPSGPDELPEVPREWDGLAIAADRSEAAAVSADGRELSRWKGRNRFAVPFFATDLGHPAYDDRGMLWVGGTGVGPRATSRLWAVPIAGNPADPKAATPRPVRAGWLVSRKVTQVRLSRDGERVAVVSTAPGGGGARLELAGVVRGAGGVPQRLAAPVRLGRSVTGIRGLAWLDDRTLVVLARGPLGDRRPYLIGVSGQQRDLPPVAAGVAVAASGTERDVYVVTRAGRILGRAGQRWVPVGEGSDLVEPGG